MNPTGIASLLPAEVEEVWDVAMNGFHDNSFGYTDVGGWHVLVGNRIIRRDSQGIIRGVQLPDDATAISMFDALATEYDAVYFYPRRETP